MGKSQNRCVHRANALLLQSKKKKLAYGNSILGHSHSFACQSNSGSHQNILFTCLHKEHVCSCGRLGCAVLLNTKSCTLIALCWGNTTHGNWEVAQWFHCIFRTVAVAIDGCFVHVSISPCFLLLARGCWTGKDCRCRGQKILIFAAGASCWPETGEFSKTGECTCLKRLM